MFSPETPQIPKHMTKLFLTLIAAIAGLWFLDSSLDITTAAAEVGKWRNVIISNKTVLFFFNLVMIALIGGLVSSRFKKRRVVRISIMMMTWMIIYAVGFGTSQITTLPIDAGP